MLSPESSSRAAESGDGDGGASAEERVDAPGVLAAADDERHHRRPRRQVSSLKTNIHRRMKKMTNPLAEKHRAPTPPPDWSAVFSDPDRPTVVDVGCAKGRFLQRAATSDAERFERDASRLLGGEGGTAEPPFNFLGLEIYEPIVLDALRWTEARYRERSDTDERATLKRDEGITDAEGISEGGSTTGGSGGETRARTRTQTRTQTQTQTPGVLKQTDAGSRTLPKNYSRGRNLHFIACNANASLPGFVASGLRVDLLCVLFPDPWSRRKHASRRVVTPEFVRALADAARPGARVYCCSDVRALAEEMQALIVNEGGAAFELDEETYQRVGEAEFECEEGAGPGGAGGERGASVARTRRSFASARAHHSPRAAKSRRRERRGEAPPPREETETRRRPEEEWASRGPNPTPFFRPNENRVPKKIVSSTCSPRTRTRGRRGRRGGRGGRARPVGRGGGGGDARREVLQVQVAGGEPPRGAHGEGPRVREQVAPGVPIRREEEVSRRRADSDEPMHSSRLLGIRYARAHTDKKINRGPRRTSPGARKPRPRRRGRR